MDSPYLARALTPISELTLTRIYTTNGASHEHKNNGIIFFMLGFEGVFTKRVQF
jgi:hypothetical protein